MGCCPLLSVTVRYCPSLSVIGRRHVGELAALVPDARFEDAFGAGKDALPALLDSSAVTLGKLLAVAPPGTLDPTPLLYTDTMHGCAGLLALGAVANAAMSPVHPSHHMKPGDEA